MAKFNSKQNYRQRAQNTLADKKCPKKLGMTVYFGSSFSLSHFDSGFLLFSCCCHCQTHASSTSSPVASFGISSVEEREREV